jgi:polysaccharide export outer membrane protein
MLIIVTFFLFTFSGFDDVNRIEPGDVLEIVILGEEELSRDLLVMHNGNITFPLIGDIRVAGLSTNEVADTISTLLKRYFVQPLVSVILKGPTISTVAVYGEVLRPGTVQYQRGLRLSDYVALAGGPTDRANLKKVKVVRNTQTGVQVYTVNLGEILKKGIDRNNFELKAGDWIYIGRRFAINWTYILQVATLSLTAVNLYITITR